MGTLSNPKTWVPYINTKDCSQGFCSLYCPQWCYIIFPPPPPFVFPDEKSGPNFSPLVIAIIGILASAFLLVSYYAIISKYCGNRDSSRREIHDPNVELEENHDPSNHEPWHVAANGLDEALIKSITVCKYTKGDGLVEGTDCSVCLSEFEEDESLKLLPKCSHAFHVICIDTWLRSHSNCPLCRATIVFVSASPPLLPPPITDTPTTNEPQHHGPHESDNVTIEQNTEICIREEEESSGSDVVLEAPIRAHSDLGDSKEHDTIIEIRDEDQQIRRSVSMDYSCQTRVSISDILHINQDEVFQIEECRFAG
ncbi:unnamed protein product [Ilex paraguariensis]|uniref:RING-type E3 ubiquitin transferase n=1 Tax=Ilex paraguariensis TaxID=185542 RepID=A0ABC8RH41_9AQUA